MVKEEKLMQVSSHSIKIMAENTKLYTVGREFEMYSSGLEYGPGTGS
jgi:hypothetical protein